MPHLFARFPGRLLRLIVLALSTAVVANGVAYAAGPMDAATARKKVAARGLGHEVKLVRKDGSEIQGIIVGIGADRVDVRPRGGGDPYTVAFQDVAAVKKLRTGMPMGEKIAIGLGIGAILTVVALVIYGLHEFGEGLKNGGYLSL